MIEYVHVQLSAWGRWTIRRSSAALGYPKVSPMFNTARFDGSYGSRPPAGIDVCGSDHLTDTDAAVSRLSHDKRRLCIEYYVVGGTGCEIAKRLGIAKRTLYDRLTAMQSDLLGHLNDVVAGC